MFLMCPNNNKGYAGISSILKKAILESLLLLMFNFEMMSSITNCVGDVTITGKCQAFI